MGCGNGHLLALLARRGAHATLVGIDRSALQVRKAAERLSTLSTPPQVHHCALEDAPALFTGAPFTRIVAMNVNLAWTDPAAAGEALRALLAPRGRVVLGFEPPTPGGRITLQVKLERAVARAGFALHGVHEDAASSTFAVEWRHQPTRARTGSE